MVNRSAKFIKNGFAGVNRRLPQSLAPVRNIVDELSPQIASISFKNTTPVNLSLTTTPQKLTLFDTEEQIGDQIVASHANNELQVDTDPLGFLNHQTVALDFSTDTDVTVVVELYLDDTATGFLFEFTADNAAINNVFKTGHFYIAPNINISFYVYTLSGSASVDVYSAYAAASKVPFGIEDQPIVFFMDLTADTTNYTSDNTNITADATQVT